MTPVIYTTGRKEAPIRIEALPGEELEAMRADAGMNTVIASDNVILGRLKTSKESLTELQMPEELAEQVVEAAGKGKKGVRVTFETEFLPREGAVLPRRYRNFRLSEE